MQMLDPMWAYYVLLESANMFLLVSDHILQPFNKIRLLFIELIDILVSLLGQTEFGI